MLLILEGDRSLAVPLKKWKLLALHLFRYLRRATQPL